MAWTVNDVVKLADTAWRENIIDKPLHDDLKKIGDDFGAALIRADADFGTSLAMIAALSSTLAFALRDAAKEEGFQPQNIELLADASADLFRRAFSTMMSQ